MYVMVPYIFLTLHSQTSLENLQGSQKKKKLHPLDQYKVLA